MDIVTLALAKKFAAKVASGFSHVEVDGLNIIFTLNDGSQVTLTVPEPVSDISITDMNIDNDGNLICTMSNGKTFNAGRIKFNPKGIYDNSIQYSLFDLINYNGSSYIAKDNTIGNLPTNSQYWQLIAEKGETGEVSQTQFDDLQEQVKDKENNQLTGQASGTSIDLSDSADSRVKSIELEGNSTQETTEGNQIFDKDYFLQHKSDFFNAYSGYFYAINVTDIFGDKYKKQITASISLKGQSMSGVALAFTTSYGTSPGGATRILTTDGTIKNVTYDFTNAENVYFQVGASTQGTAVNNLNDIFANYEIMLNEGSTALPYEEYTGGIPSPNPSYPQPILSAGDNGTIGEKIVNENFLPNNQTSTTINSLPFTVNSDKSITVKGTPSANSDLYFVGTSSQYEDLGLKEGVYNLNGCRGGSDTTYMLYCVQKRGNDLIYNQNYGEVGQQITHQKGDLYRIFIRVLSGKTVDTIFYPALNKGTTALPYRPHQEQNFIIPTQQPMRAIGDVRDLFFKNVQGSEYYDSTLTENAWYERHNIARVIFDGTETWTVEQSSGMKRFKYTISDLYYYNGRGEYAKSNYFHSTTNSEYGAIIIYQSRIMIYVSENITTVEQFTAWIAEKYANNNPLYVDYYTTEPTDLLCTEAQTEALEAYMKARTYKNVTHIYTEDEVPAYIELEYIKDLEQVIDNTLPASKIITLTQDEYDAIQTKDDDTYYFIKEDTLNSSVNTLNLNNFSGLNSTESIENNNMREE